MREEVHITFDSESTKVTVEAVGVVGPGCKAFTRPYEEALGILGAPDTLKPAYHQTAVKATVKAGRP